METAKELLERAYESEWIKGTPNSENCSGFLKSVGKSMGFYLPNADADGIIEELERLAKSLASVWEKIGTGRDALEKATQKAAAGRLVIAAATAKDYGQTHGHVAVLLPKVAGPHKAPLIYCGGSAAARSKGTKTIREVWSPSKHDRLRFFMHRTKDLGEYS